MRTFDLAVIGGGPAGASCALAASRAGLEVVLFEPQSGAMDKPCGEGLMPEGIRALDELGLSDAIASGRSFSRLTYVLPRGDPLEVPLPSPGLALDRPRLQRSFALASARETRLQIVRAHARAERESDAFAVRADGEVVRARSLAIADGARGTSAPWLRTHRHRARTTERFGVRARFVEAERLEGVEVHLGRGCEVYLTPLPPAESEGRGRVNVAVLLDRAPDGLRSAGEVLEWALERHPRAREHLELQLGTPEARALGQIFPRERARARAFLLGDAGGSVDPILGCGVTIALQTGIHAARGAVALANGEDPVSVAREYERVYRREAAARRVLALWLHRLSSHPRLLAASAGLLRRSPALLARMVALAAG